MENPILLAALGGLLTCGLTGLGGAAVFLFKRNNQKVLGVMLGVSAGVMVAASFWSLLSPAFELSGTPLVPLAGFLSGGAFLYLANRFLPFLHGQPDSDAAPWRRCSLLVTAITLHNIPEGLSIGVAFGAAVLQPETLPAAVALAVGIGIQNIPEGAAISLPLRREGISRGKSFLASLLSGVVEPLAAVLGAALAVAMRALLPYALSFAAGAMLFVVVDELIPEAQTKKSGHAATIGALLGFALMMVLDTALG